jgi:hypothetical protein
VAKYILKKVRRYELDIWDEDRVKGRAVLDTRMNKMRGIS